jgi:hypothetical protein
MLRLRLLAPALALAALLGGCVTYAPTIPEGYAGPRAVLRDTALTHSGSKVDYFFVSKINGAAIKESRTESMVANQGRGFSMDPVLLDREVPAGTSIKIELVGRTEYAAPILALTNKVYQVKGEITLEPAEGRTYAIKGVLGEDYSAVWLEDTATREVVGEKIEVKGSAKLGFWSK